jgi:hypothetical protein
MDALDTLEVLRKNIIGTSDKGSAMDLMVAIKAADEMLKELKSRNIQAANTEFRVLQAQNPNLKNHAFTHGIANSYTLPAKWKFSEKHAEKKEALKVLEAKEKANGTAEKIAATFDSAKNASFSIKLNSAVTFPEVASV